MTIEKAIKLTKEITRMPLPYMHWDNEHYEALQLAIQALYDSKNSMNSWIPVSERLPKETESEYWVCTDYGYQCQCHWTKTIFGEESTWGWKIFDIPRYSKIIAWMPLPESYKIESEDKV